MANIKQRLRRYNGTDYDTVHLETDGSVVEVELSGGEVSILNTDSPVLGDKTVYFRDYPDIKWQVQHIDGDYVYLALTGNVETSAFGSNTTYSGSTIASKCTTFLNNTIPNVAQYLEDVTVEDVTAKVFIPSKAMYESDWDYPKQSVHQRRTAIDNWSSVTYSIWTSTAGGSSYVWKVEGNGEFYSSHPSNTFGFRPAVKVKYKQTIPVTTTKALNTVIGDIGTEIDTLKTSVSEGKAAIASAITDKGVSTASDASFSTMATNIGAIQTSSIVLSSIAVTTAPSKTTYIALETFSSTGMVVTATYSNGATRNVTSGCTWPTTALNAGTTSITITYSEDGVTKTTTQAITVNKISVTVPSQSGTLTYTGSSQNPSWNNKPSTSIATYGGTTSGTNAGSYTATFTLVDTSNYKWADTTTAARNVTWSISQAANSMALSKSSMTLNASKTSDTLTISGNYDGTVSVSSNNTSVATATRSGSTVTVNSVNSTTGSATITVSASGSNYTAASKTCAVTATFFVNPLNTDQLTLGMNTVYFVAYPNIKWCVDHIDGNYVYLGGYNINQTVVFSYNNYTDYYRSDIAKECSSYLNNTIPNVADYLEDVTVEGVTNKVFIPTYYQFSGNTGYGDTSGPVFSYPSASTANRRACYAALTSNGMWLSTVGYSDNVMYVNSGGSFTYNSPSYTWGFRPEVKVRYKA